MKAVQVSRGRRGSSVQTGSAIVGVSSRWAAISAAGSSRQKAAVRLLATSWSGDDSLGEGASVEGQAVLRGQPELRDCDLLVRDSATGGRSFASNL